ncbi:hypothetical protein NC652_028399 [Populus alba x Populus x berolinensis]|nr:hypothetical protein NC652_028399 [Populus alba x Populus x berolinensis]
MKPVIYVENVAESDLADSETNPYVKEVMNLSGLVTISAQMLHEAGNLRMLIIAGMTAPQAAGVIHSDFEKGFIPAETSYFRFSSPLRRLIYLHCLSVAVENSSRRRCNAVSFQRLTVIILNINTSGFFSNTIKLVNNLNTAQVKERF